MRGATEDLLSGIRYVRHAKEARKTSHRDGWILHKVVHKKESRMRSGQRASASAHAALLRNAPPQKPVEKAKSSFMVRVWRNAASTSG